MVDLGVSAIDSIDLANVRSRSTLSTWTVEFGNGVGTYCDICATF